jgi:hypothetical protein
MLDSVKRETLILMILCDEPLDKINTFYESLEKHLETSGKEMSKATVQYAYAALIAKDIESAKTARGRFYDFYEVSYDPNDEFDKRLVDEIDRRLAAQVQTAGETI